MNFLNKKKEQCTLSLAWNQKLYRYIHELQKQKENAKIIDGKISYPPSDFVEENGELITAILKSLAEVPHGMD